MNIWLIHPCNQLPGDAWRESRIQSIASALVARGHECLWWTANFSHHTKSFRSKGWKDIDVQPCYRIRLVPTPAYYRHVGLARLRFHWLLSWRIYRRGRTERRPDAIIVNDAPLGDSWWAWCLARRFRAKLILDITDEWPEQFVLAFAPSWRRIVQPIFSPLYVIREFVRRRADGISALSKSYFRPVRNEVPNPRPGSWLFVYNGVDIEAFRKILNDEAAPEGPLRGLTKKENELWAIYAGTLGITYDITTIVKAAELLEQKRAPVRLIIAGDGPMCSVVKEATGRNGPYLTYVGKLKHQDLIHIYKRCDVGLATYSPASSVAMPDKAYDYLAAGLAIVSSLRGELADWIKNQQFGFLYQAGDAQSLADVLQALAAKPEMTRMMARHSSETAVLFDRHRQYGTYADWVEFILDQKAAVIQPKNCFFETTVHKDGPEHPCQM